MNDLFDLLQKFENELGENRDAAKLVILIGSLIYIMNSKKIFKTNQKLAEYLNRCFDIEFAEYVKKSRPLMLGRVSKQLISDGNIDINHYLNTVYKTLNELNSKENEGLTWEKIIEGLQI